MAPRPVEKVVDRYKSGARLSNCRVRDRRHQTAAKFGDGTTRVNYPSNSESIVDVHWTAIALILNTGPPAPSATFSEVPTKYSCGFILGTRRVSDPSDPSDPSDLSDLSVSASVLGVRRKLLLTDEHTKSWYPPFDKMV